MHSQELTADSTDERNTGYQNYEIWWLIEQGEEKIVKRTQDSRTNND